MEQHGAIKSIQQDNFIFGTTFYEDRTIKEVNVNKTFILTSFSCGADHGFCYSELQSSTTYKTFIGGCDIGTTFHVHTIIVEFY